MRSTRGRFATPLAERPHTETASVRTARAHDRARWAQKQSKSHALASHYGVSASRVRHFGTDDVRGPLTVVCAAAADPAVDGEAILAAVLESIEDRYHGAERKTLEARLAYLTREAEHVAQAQQDRALMINCPQAGDAIRYHARVLLEIANLRARLGMEGE